MKLGRLITRRRAKWVGAALSIFILVAFVSSLFLRIYAIRAVAESEFFLRVDLASGCLRVFQMEWTPVTGVETMPDVWLWDIEFERGWIPWKSPSGVWGFGQVFIPLYIPLLLVAVPTAYLWLVDHRPKPWQCAKCRCDLRGLEGGGKGGGDKIVCPECGMLNGGET